MPSMSYPTYKVTFYYPLFFFNSLAFSKFYKIWHVEIFEVNWTSIERDFFKISFFLPNIVIT